MSAKSEPGISLSTYSFLRFIFVTTTAILLIAGLIMFFSVTYTPALAKGYSHPYSEFLEQAMFAGVGVFLALIVANYAPNIRLSKDSLFFVYVLGFAGAFVLTLLTLFIGVEINGSKRWLYLGGIQFQPSELLKLGLAVLLGALLTFGVSKNKANFFKYFRFWLGIVITFVCMVITVLQPDLGTTSVLFAIGCLAMLFGGLRKRYVLLLVVIIFVSILIAIYVPSDHFDYARNRISAWLDPEATKTTTGYQGLQSQLSIAIGGMYGKGFLKSEGKLGRLPFHDTDFIYSVISEELGLVGGGILIFLYLLLGVLGYLLAAHSPSKLGKTLGPVLVFMIVVQALIHIFTNLQIIPATGITLPFFSKGGTSLIVTLVTIGVFLRATRRIV